MTAANSTERVLESLVQITEHRDRDRLETSLARTLVELTPMEQVRLYRLQTNYGERELREMVRGTRGGVLTSETDSLVLDAPVPLRAADGFLQCYETRRPVTTSDPGGGVRCLYPVLGVGEVIGFLELRCARPEALDGHLVSGFLGIYQNYLRLLHESEHDTLTGLLNRKTFEANLVRILRDGREPPEPPGPAPTARPRRRKAHDGHHWLAVIDIDHFKQINDRFGHLYGDEVLLLHANLMRQSFRASDRLFRFGGEEFVALLHLVDFKNASLALERFRKRIERHHFPQVGRVTVSIGFVQVKSQDVPAEVVGHADEALYYAKQHGRNQVCSYEQLVTEGKLRKAAAQDDITLF
jgi:diguanylate cyclase (GGDEF)-like protein